MLEQIIASYLNGQKTEHDCEKWRIQLSNGKEIEIEKNPVSSTGTAWAWRIDCQYFDNEDIAVKYLRQLVTEKLTGKRVLLRKKGAVPEICGIDGIRCRNPLACNSALCSHCPVADAFFADRDGVELIYAI